MTSSLADVYIWANEDIWLYIILNLKSVWNSGVDMSLSSNAYPTWSPARSFSVCDWRPGSPPGQGGRSGRVRGGWRCWPGPGRDSQSRGDTAVSTQRRRLQGEISKKEVGIFNFIQRLWKICRSYVTFLRVWRFTYVLL